MTVPTEALFVERLLNRADLSAEELRTRLGHFARCDKPGIQIEYVIETWKQWNEINPASLDEESAKLKLDFEVYKAACELVTPAGAR